MGMAIGLLIMFAIYITVVYVNACLDKRNYTLSRVYIDTKHNDKLVWVLKKDPVLVFFCLPIEKEEYLELYQDKYSWYKKDEDIHFEVTPGFAKLLDNMQRKAEWDGIIEKAEKE